MEHEKNAAGGGLSVERTTNLAIERVDEAVESDQRERTDHREDDRGEDEEGPGRISASAPSPDGGEEDREKDDRIKLGGHRRAEHTESETVTTLQDGCHGNRTHRCRQQVVAQEQQT